MKKRIAQMCRGRYARRGMTLTELLMAMLLLSLVFLAVSALYVAAQRLYFTSSNTAMIGYELQHAIQHVYKNAMRGMGDKASPAISTPTSETLNIRINTNDPLTSSNYTSVTAYTYYKSGNALMFNDGFGPQSLVPTLTVTAVNFSLSGNALIGYITASYGSQSLTLYFSCYPRLATFH